MREGCEGGRGVRDQRCVWEGCVCVKVGKGSEVCEGCVREGCEGGV